MKRRWINPVTSARREKRVRLNIIKDLIKYDLLECKPIETRRLDTPHLTRAISFETITMATEVQER